VSLVVIGSGPGGYVAAIKAAQLGEKVTVIEDTAVGGTCLNKGCIPTKVLIGSTSLLSRMRNARSYGIDISCTPAPNLEQMMARKDKIISLQAKGIMGLFKSRGVEYTEGRGRIIEKVSGKSSDKGPYKYRVEVTRPDNSIDTITADNIILATGSRPASIPSLPIDEKSILSSDGAIELKDIPQSIIIVGAGVIGSEWACIFRDLGSEVTILELMDRAVGTEDTEISALLAREFRKKKIKLLLNTKIDSLSVTKGGVKAVLDSGEELTAKHALVSIGRAYNSQDIGLEEMGVKLGSDEEVLVDSTMQTNIKGIYAIGDLVGGMLLAHKATAEGIVAAQNIAGQSARMDYSTIPAAIFTSPEIASVGLRDFQAHEQNIPVKTGTFEYRALGKAHALGEIEGMFKVISHAESDIVLGAHIIGAHASDIIHEAAICIKNKLKTSDLTATIHAHPTLSEGLLEAAEDVHGQAIHKLGQS